MPEVSPSSGLVRFGGFELDRRSGELRKAASDSSFRTRPLKCSSSCWSGRANSSRARNFVSASCLKTDRRRNRLPVWQRLGFESCGAR
jgi:hypothetical protein